MSMALVWLLVVYAALKLGSVLFVGQAGFRRSRIGWPARLRAREPALFLAAVIFAVPAALLAGDYSHRAFAAQHDHAVACYGALLAVRDVPPFSRGEMRYTAYDRMRSDRDFAYVTGAQIGLKTEAIGKALDESAQRHASRLAALKSSGARQAMQSEIETAWQCLLPLADGANG